MKLKKANDSKRQEILELVKQARKNQKNRFKNTRQVLQTDKKDLKIDNENVPPSQCHLDGRGNPRCEKLEQEKTFIS